MCVLIRGVACGSTSRTAAAIESKAVRTSTILAVHTLTTGNIRRICRRAIKGSFLRSITIGTVGLIGTAGTMGAGVRFASFSVGTMDAGQDLTIPTAYARTVRRILVDRPWSAMDAIIGTSGVASTIAITAECFRGQHTGHGASKGRLDSVGLRRSAPPSALGNRLYASVFSDFSSADRASPGRR
jgi:hypothetical protein